MRLVPGAGDRRATVRAALPAVAIVVLSAAVYGYHQEIERLGGAAASLQEEAAARALRGRLIGRRMADVSFTAPGEGEDEGEVRGGGRGLQVLWLVDPRRCVGCLGDLAGWRRLTRVPDVDNALVLVGVDRRRAREMAEEAGVRSAVRWDADGSAASRLIGEAPPPSLLLLLGPDRRILGAEAGYRKASCDPATFRQLATLIETIGEEVERGPTAGDEQADGARGVRAARESNTERGEIDEATDP